MKQNMDLTGKTFGRLTVISEADRKIRKNGKPKRQYLCKCECGGTAIREITTLLSNNISSCGCYNSEVTAKRNFIHGKSREKLYKVWRSFKERCYNPNNKKYKNYGARGIVVSERWLTFMNFYNDMGDSYKKGLTIERDDVNGNYEKSNCRWATPLEQGRNKTNNRFLVVKGVKKCVSEFAELMGYNKHLLRDRLDRGWNDEDAVLGKVNKEENYLLLKSKI